MAEQTEKKAPKNAPKDKNPEIEGQNQAMAPVATEKAETEKPKTASAKPGPIKVGDWVERKKLATWQSAALLRAQGWLNDKTVTEAEFDQALSALKTRNQGGNNGRRR